MYVELTNINTSMNKYAKYYNLIIDNRKQHPIIDQYTEQHHIIPRSLGGNDATENLVNLSAREHFICHWLLTKMYSGEARGKMINAMYMMRGNSTHQKRYESKITARIYENLRQEYSDYISKLNKGRIQPPEEKAKQIAATTGRKREPFSDEWRKKLSESKKGSRNNMYGRAHSGKTRKKMSEKAKGRKQSSETITKKADAVRGSKREKRHCPHCDQMIAVNTYPRWHGDNCKHNPAS